MSEPMVSIVDVVKEYHLGKTVVPGAAGRLAGGPPGEFISIAGPVGQRQDDAAQPDRLRGHGHLGRGEVAGKDTSTLSERRADRPAAAHHRLHLPELQPGLGAQRLPERGVPAAAAAEARRGRAARAGDDAARAGGPGRPRQAPAERAVRRPAPARGGGARAGDPAADRARRRADREPRLGDRPEHHRPDEGAEPAARAPPSSSPPTTRR